MSLWAARLLLIVRIHRLPALHLPGPQALGHHFAQAHQRPPRVQLPRHDQPARPIPQQHVLVDLGALPQVVQQLQRVLLRLPAQSAQWHIREYSL